MRFAMTLSMVSAMALSGAAVAGPRDTVTFNNVDSDGATPGVASFTKLAGYEAKFVRVQGWLQKVNAATFAKEASIRLMPNSGSTTWALLAPTATTNFAIESVDAFVRLPKGMAGTAGITWYVNTFESFDDGAGPDAVWTTLKLTLNDGPPASAVNLGPISSGSISRTGTLAVGQTMWYKFELQSGVNAPLSTYLDIDTEGSAVGSASVDNDTMMALYNEDGILVGVDDDSGTGYLSQLSFGAGTRPSAGLGGVAYDGRNGSLLPGVYYLAVRGLTDSAPLPGWDYPTFGGHQQAGSLKVTIRTNTGEPVACPVDFNRNGVLEVQDIFDYLNGWFAGCP
jgi:hypothetical protein